MVRAGLTVVVPDPPYHWQSTVVPRSVCDMWQLIVPICQDKIHSDYEQLIYLIIGGYFTGGYIAFEILRYFEEAPVIDVVLFDSVFPSAALPCISCVHKDTAREVEMCNSKANKACSEA